MTKLLRAGMSHIKNNKIITCIYIYIYIYIWFENLFFFCVFALLKIDSYF